MNRLVIEVKDTCGSAAAHGGKPPAYREMLKTIWRLRLRLRRSLKE
jgi:hypothetical protein